MEKAVKSKSFQDGLEKAWKDYVKSEREKHYPNIMLLGISGAGKSSLVNTIFGIDAALVSNIEPETSGYCNFYDGHDYSRKINLIDTAGYELNQADKYLENVLKAIHNGAKGSPVHVLWYCIAVSNERIEDIDLRLLKDLQKDAVIQQRICVVFTKCDEDDEEASREKTLKNVLVSNGLGNLKHFSVSTDPKLPLDLAQLVEWSSIQIKDEDLRKAFIGSQMVDLAMKKKEADKIINNACMTIGALKLSGLVSAKDHEKILAEHQMKMITEIFSVYGIDSLAGLTKKFKSATGVLDFGSGLVSLIINAIPKIRNFENLISTVMPSALTKAIGTVASQISYSYVEKHIKGIPVKLEEYFANPDSAGIIATLVNDLLSTAGNKLSRKDEKPKETTKKDTSRTTNKKPKAVNKKAKPTRKK